MRVGRQYRGEDDGRCHDDKEEKGDEQASEIRLDGLQRAAHRTRIAERRAESIRPSPEMSPGPPIGRRRLGCGARRAEGGDEHGRERIRRCVTERAQETTPGSAASAPKMRVRRGGPGLSQPQEAVAARLARRGLAGAASSWARLWMYSWTREMTVAWLQVKGETEIGAPEYGSSCSGSTPLGRAAAATQSRIRAAASSSVRVFARATSHCAYHMVQMNQGLPGTFSMSWLSFQ